MRTKCGMALRVWSARLGLPLLRGEEEDDTAVVADVAVVVVGEVNAARAGGDFDGVDGADNLA